MVSKLGSIWRKWDFHVHTPYSILNNGFGFDPYEDTSEGSFDEFVIKLFTKAIEEEVAAIGVTDYFSIDGYKRLKNDYLSNEGKLETLFPDSVLREKVKGIYVFPNIELRINNFVGEKAHSVNFHVIFSDEIPADDIETYFLNKLVIDQQLSDSGLTTNKSSIEKIGKEIIRKNPESRGSALLIGYQNISVTHTEIVKILHDYSGFENKYLISIPVDEDLSRISWQGRDYTTRQALYKECDCYMTANAKTRQWALARGEEDLRIQEFGSIKPCIWGSDAHSYDRLFRPDDERFCWVKADTTFEGLRQILFEPDERVKIQATIPEEKDPHQVIQSVQFKDESFSEEPIFFNDGLNCIIGGKSTGKSILLRHVAKLAAPSVVKRQELQLHRTPPDFPGCLTWADGSTSETSGDRKIIYVPQAWLNSLVDQHDNDTQLNQLLEDIFFQDMQVSDAHQVLMQKNEEAVKYLQHVIIDYCLANQKADEAEQWLKENGRVPGFKKQIETLEEKRNRILGQAGVTEESSKKYYSLEEAITKKKEQLKNLQIEKDKIASLKGDAPRFYIPGLSILDDTGKVVYVIAFSDQWVSETIGQSVEEINKTAQDKWAVTINQCLSRLAEKENQLSNDIKALASEYEPLKEKMLISESAKSVGKQIVEEKEKLLTALAKETEQRQCYAEMQAKKKAALEQLREIANNYSQFCEAFNAITREGTSLEFSAKREIRKEDFFSTIQELFNNRNFKAFQDKYGYSLSDTLSVQVDEKLLSNIWEALEKGILSLKGAEIRQSALTKLCSDWYFIHYSVKSGNDTINEMSPGKKAIVLLELMVYQEKGNCPILIDQPEDDLDNRSIYSDLVAYLREKKHQRQIIVVTHNANIVIGADAEEVIIANQDGIGSKNGKYRFEYRSGAIENVTPLYDEYGSVCYGILNEKGIKQQVCDILEGGVKAFQIREKKYLTNSFEESP